jgi:hypothetical protein
MVKRWQDTGGKTAGGKTTGGKTAGATSWWPENVETPATGQEAGPTWRGSSGAS